MEKEVDFTPLEDEFLFLCVARDIDEDLCDCALDAFSTDEAMQKAINWLKENPEFTNTDISHIMGKFGVESENFHLGELEDE